MPELLHSPRPYMYVPLVVLASNGMCVGSPTLCFFNGLYIQHLNMVCIQKCMQCALCCVALQIAIYIYTNIMLNVVYSGT